METNQKVFNSFDIIDQFKNSNRFVQVRGDTLSFVESILSFQHFVVVIADTIHLSSSTKIPNPDESTAYCKTDFQHHCITTDQFYLGWQIHSMYLPILCDSQRWIASSLSATNSLGIELSAGCPLSSLTIVMKKACSFTDKKNSP